MVVHNGIHRCLFLLIYRDILTGGKIDRQSGSRMRCRILRIGFIVIIVGSRFRIVPCHIHIPVETPYFHNIPRVILPCKTRAVIAGNLQLLHQILERPCISRADTLSEDDRTVGALVQLCLCIVLHDLHQRIMHKPLLVIIRFGICTLRQDFIDPCIKYLLCALEIVSGLIIFQLYFHTDSGFKIFTGKLGIQPEKLRMVVVYRLDHIVRLFHRHSDNRRKCRIQVQGIGIYLTVQRLQGLVEHRIVGIILR